MLISALNLGTVTQQCIGADSLLEPDSSVCSRNSIFFSTGCCHLEHVHSFNLLKMVL